jgi:type I restriction enzyme, R subunit
MDKRSLTERDICTKFILPAVKRAGWDEMLQVREEVYFTKGRIIVRGKLVTRGNAKKADVVLYYKPNIPIATLAALSVKEFTAHLEIAVADKNGPAHQGG